MYGICQQIICNGTLGLRFPICLEFCFEPIIQITEIIVDVWHIFALLLIVLRLGLDQGLAM